MVFVHLGLPRTGVVKRANSDDGPEERLLKPVLDDFFDHVIIPVERELRVHDKPMPQGVVVVVDDGHLLVENEVGITIQACSGVCGVAFIIFMKLLRTSQNTAI